jgi:hypothetical protein
MNKDFEVNENENNEQKNDNETIKETLDCIKSDIELTLPDIENMSQDEQYCELRSFVLALQEQLNDLCCELNIVD